LKQINWDELFRKNAAQLKGLCRRYVGDTDVAEDLVQDTFITAINKVSGYKATGSLEGWIRKIAVNKALMFVREKQLIPIPRESLANPIEQETDMEDSKNKIRIAIEKASFNSNELLSVIDYLPVHHKIVFNLYVLDGYTHNQIAKMMSISPGTSKSHLARARKKAQELLYQKAIQQQPAENYRRGAFLLLLFQPNYIDKLFRKGLNGYQLVTNPPAIPISSAPVTMIKWGTTLAGKIVTYGTAFTIVTGGGYLASKTIEETNQLINVPAPTGISVPLDSLKSQSIDSKNVDSVKMQEITAPKPVKKGKVIIKKTIVVHDTIHLEKPAAK
jgi:RNA polymerase sigma factor (sigma-70 family)